MDKDKDSQEPGGTDNILKDIDSENILSINNEENELKKYMDKNYPSLQKSALLNISSMTPRSSDVSKVIKFFDGPGPDIMNKSKFSYRGYSSNRQTTQQNNLSLLSDLFGR